MVLTSVMCDSEAAFFHGWKIETEGLNFKVIAVAFAYDHTVHVRLAQTSLTEKP